MLAQAPWWTTSDFTHFSELIPRPWNTRRHSRCVASGILVSDLSLCPDVEQEEYTVRIALQFLSPVPYFCTPFLLDSSFSLTPRRSESILSRKRAGCAYCEESWRMAWFGKTAFPSARLLWTASTGLVPWHRTAMTGYGHCEELLVRPRSYCSSLALC